MKRCEWVPPDDPLYVEYHDMEWGVPVHDDQTFFEFLVLEGAQAGLSWKTILQKRDGYRDAFSNFDPSKVAVYSESRIKELQSNPGIVRNRLKISSAVQNAEAFLKVQEEFGSFDTYIWKFVGGKPIDKGWAEISQVPSKTAESDALSMDLKKRGFKFAGSAICYAFMQATGLVNDHITRCFRYGEITGRLA
ncbi:MAG TPA: DNA-3-methyladenine glycosylase I [Thermoplasmataceae archaeon]|nr:DNA-3-methyladenine glycosylase I [Thermoplasmataceae archaeon]